jgi:hypothetical protein
MKRLAVVSLLVAAQVAFVGSTSVSSCGDLGWTNANEHGSTAVCGESDKGMGGCSGDLSYGDADLFCRKKWGGRGRLCTVAELENVEMQDATCDYEGEMLWSSTGVCGDNGYYQVRGDGEEDTTVCMENIQAVAATAKVRCCSDTALDADDRGDCPTLMRWNAAVLWCERKGARMCTQAELQDDNTRGTGCNSDRKLVWSSTECTGRWKQGQGKVGHTYKGYYQAWGSTEFGSTSPCVQSQMPFTADVRCCADV